MKSTIVLAFLAAGAIPALAKFDKNDEGMDKIVGGSPATKGEFPHIVQIRRNERQYCAGSIINANYIVTAAHCTLASSSGYTLVPGEHNLNEREGTEQYRYVTKIIRHPSYNRSTYANDVAVMRISSPFVFNKYVRVVSIPSASLNPASELTVAGWGRLGSGGSLPNVLMKVTVPFVSKLSCREAYGSSILNGMLCAGTAGKDSCQGDSGGPLMSGSTLVGIVSWGAGCAHYRYPGVYSDVSFYFNWIKRQIR